MLRAIFATITFTSLFTLQSVAEELTIKPGETLSEIASRYEVSIFTLKALNNLKDPSKIQAGQKLKIPEKNNKDFYSIKRVHVVNYGETLSSIAMRNGITQKELINLNNLSRADYIYPGQKLKLTNSTEPPLASNYHSKTADIENSPKRENLATGLIDNSLAYEKSIHIVSPGETLSEISKNYSVPLKNLITINNLTNPHNLNIGTKIILKPTSKNKTSKIAKSSWQEYGPLKIYWSGWKAIDGSYVAPSLNENKKALYIAVNCKFERINATGSNGAWGDWEPPSEIFEHNLIKNLCISKQS